MVPAVHDLPAVVLERLRALPDGARLLEAAAGIEGLHLVGGAVRDLLLDRTPRELDLVAEADGPAVAERLAERLGGRVRAHAAFGTATVEGDGLPVDVATARAESYPRPGALPVVRPGTLEEDLARRDFTINAIAVGVSPDRLGALHAFPGAIDDLRERLLRVLHDRSFVDDPTRLVRLARYAGRGFAVEERTAELAQAAFASGAPATAGPARMGRELWLLLGERSALDALRRLDELAGDAGVEPGLSVDRPLLEAVLALLPPDASREHALLAALVRDADPDALRAWLAAAHVPSAERILDAVRDPVGLARAMCEAQAPSALERLLRRRSVEAVVLAGAVGAEEPAREYLERLRHTRLTIDGEDLLAAGVPQGPEIGRRLDAALARKLDEGLRSREEELAAALE